MADPTEQDYITYISSVLTKITGSTGWKTGVKPGMDPLKTVFDEMPMLSPPADENFAEALNLPGAFIGYKDYSVTTLAAFMLKNKIPGPPDLSQLEADVATNTANIDGLTSKNTTNTASITTNTADIATNTADIATNTTDIAALKKGGTDSDLQKQVSTNTAALLTVSYSAAANTASISTNTASIATNLTDIGTLKITTVSNTEAIATLKSDNSTQDEDLTTVDTKITTLNDSLTGIQAAVDALKREISNLPDPSGGVSEKDFVALTSRVDTLEEKVRNLT